MWSMGFYNWEKLYLNFEQDLYTTDGELVLKRTAIDYVMYLIQT